MNTDFENLDLPFSVEVEAYGIILARALREKKFMLMVFDEEELKKPVDTAFNPEGFRVLTNLPRDFSLMPFMIELMKYNCEQLDIDMEADLSKFYELHPEVKKS